MHDLSGTPRAGSAGGTQGDAQAAARRLRDDVGAKRQRVLQLEAEAVELQKRLSVTSRVAADRRAEAEQATTELREREVDADRRHAERLRALRDSRDELEAQQARLEDGWRALEDAISAADGRVDAERHRLRDALAAADTREAALRENQRALAARERDLAARRRRLQFRAEQLRRLDSARLAALRAEL
eukprot:CAMPEP_0174839220 /NCGR_PEP_ID=MMETSP1114-20130205/7904_1 /TAXON_ID=312471 /ORGANISM="Neobodo designis, Strain CCAP 1951/1" /LENGTH=187 /DNA_ID=CAMNT_0016073341 /DNA_START=40 /DNA_END=600 /DNA_ORIENTATION=-